MIMKKLYKFLFLTTVFGSMYIGLEYLYRGYSHWTMAIVGALCGFIIGGINEVLSWETPVWLQAIYGGIIVTIIEFIAGFIINIVLGLKIWDYSNLPYNLFGQICIPFFGIWCLLSIVAIFFDDYIRYFVFGEEKPRCELPTA